MMHAFVWMMDLVLPFAILREARDRAIRIKGTIATSIGGYQRVWALQSA